MRVMVVEDSMLVREGLNRVLTGLGHQVVAAVPRADQVAGLMMKHSPDVVVTDIKMPPTFTDEGLRLAATIRRRRPGVAVLVLSQYVEVSYATVLLEGGSRCGYLL